MYAIIETGGKQIKVEEGQEVYIEKLDAEAGETVSFDQVLLVSGDELKVGAPFVEGASVKATVAKQGRAKKRLSFSKLSRKRTTAGSKVTVNLIRKSLLIKSMRN